MFMNSTHTLNLLDDLAANELYPKQETVSLIFFQNR